MGSGKSGGLMDVGLKFPKGNKKKKRMSHPASILGSRKGRFYLCGRYAQTEEHHIFGGPNRKLSEEYGLKVDLCRECHQFGLHAVHRDQAVMDDSAEWGRKLLKPRVAAGKNSGRYLGGAGCKYEQNKKSRYRIVWNKYRESTGCFPTDQE